MSLKTHLATRKKFVSKKLPDYSAYKYDPIGFCTDILKLTLTAKQKEICDSLMTPPHRTLVFSCNGAGKTVIAASLLMWHYATRDPSITIVTAPVFDQIRDNIFRELRQFVPAELRTHLYPKLTRMESSPSHVLMGYTAENANSFQGKHSHNLMVCFEEAVGVKTEFWEAAFGCILGCAEGYFLAIANPTDVGSAMYQYEQSGNWNIVHISAMDHENIINELAGLPPMIPSAIRLDQVRLNMEEWGEFVTDHDTSEYAYLDVPFEGKYWRPGPLGDSRILGRWPALSAYSIFSESDFRTATHSTTQFLPTDIYQIGADCARFGDDRTVIHVRRGPVSILHESFHGQDTHRTANRLKELALSYAHELQIAPQKIVVRIDETGIGSGVVDQGEGFHFVGVNSAQTAISETRYPNRRSELLFSLVNLMRSGNLSLAHLPKHQVAEIKRQALGILYKPDSKGRRVAERKEDTKKRISRSPDDLDGICLAFAPYGSGDYTPHEVQREKQPIIRAKRESDRRERNDWSE